MPKPIQTLKGSVALLVITVNTLFHTVLLWLLALPKWLTPEGPFKQRLRDWLARVAESWIGFNNRLLSLYGNTRWDLALPPDLDRAGVYLVICNHQSWVDILVLQKCFNRRLPLLRFFLKRELIWVPFLGIAWWALDFPFMRRLSRQQLEKRPELKGADLESARQACEKFSGIPVAMMSFPEGTRFSEAKRSAGDSPFRHLLRPKAGGIGVVLYAFDQRLHACIDVTIAYPGRAGPPPTFWELISGQVERITVRAAHREIPGHLLGADYRSDRSARVALQHWIGMLWSAKDQELDGLLTSGPEDRLGPVE
jgi:1-acyl-sn-glycerol-3-phosphate acyltransferase